MVVREGDGAELRAGVGIDGLEDGCLHIDVLASGHDVEDIRGGIVLRRVGAGRQVDDLLLRIGGCVANAGVLLGTIRDKDGRDAFAHQNTVWVAEACDSAQMIRSLEIEDLEGPMVLRCKEQAMPIIIGSKVIEIAGVAGKIYTLNQLDGTSLLR